MGVREMTRFRFTISAVQVKAGDSLGVECEFSGILDHGFFDAVLLNLDNSPIAWLPDPNTYNSWRDSGVFSGEDTFKSSWRCFIPDWIGKAEYKFSIRVYDDLGGKRSHRKCVEGGQSSVPITILDSNHPEAVFVRKLYDKFFSRSPDIGGYRGYFEILQIRNASRRQVLELGFLRSPEFRARTVHKLLTEEDISPEKLNESIDILRKKSLLSLLMEPTYRYFIESKSREELISSIVTKLRLDEIATNELGRLSKDLASNALVLSSLFENFLIEKYILVNAIFKGLSDEQIQSKVREYLVKPDEIVNQL